MAKPFFNLGPAKITLDETTPALDFTAKVGPATILGTYAVDQSGNVTGVTVADVDLKAQPKPHFDFDLSDGTFTFHAGPVKASGEVTFSPVLPDGDGGVTTTATGEFTANAGPITLTGEFTAILEGDDEEDLLDFGIDDIADVSLADLEATVHGQTYQLPPITYDL